MVLPLTATTTLLWCAAAWALDLEGAGRWVEEASVPLGGAVAALDEGLLFPVGHEGRVVGFVFVGEARLRVPVATRGEALTLSAIGGAAIAAEGTWEVVVEPLLVVGADADVLAATDLGWPLERGNRNVSYIDDNGLENLVVTRLRPSSARADARAALRSRSLALSVVGLSLEEMLRREAWRDAPARVVVEARPQRELRRGLDDLDGSGVPEPTWLTWVVDGSALVDDTYGSVLGVHVPAPGGRSWHALTGAPHAGAPDASAVVAQVNVVVSPGAGLAAAAKVDAQLVIEAGQPTRLVDVWLPRHEAQVLEAGSVVAGEPKLGAVVTSDGRPVEIVASPFGPRHPGTGWKRLSLLLPEQLAAGEQVAVRLSWTEDWDQSHVLETQVWARAQLLNPPPGLGEMMQRLPPWVSLGKVVPGQAVVPWVATGRRDFPVELRGGTAVKGWQLSVGAGAVATSRGEGHLWSAQTTSLSTVSSGDLQETRAPAAAGLPAVRVLRHATVDDRLPELIRATLHFYADALPPYPFPEVVVVQGPSRPVLVGNTLSRMDFTPSSGSHRAKSVPTLRNAGGGQLVLEGLYEVVLAAGPSQMGITNASAIARATPHASERGIAEALAGGWWEDLGWDDRDRWLSRALPAVYRDLFVAHAYGTDAVARWDVWTAEMLRLERPRAEVARFADAWWASEVGSRLIGRAVRDRIGEPALLAALDRFLRSGEPTTERLGAELGPEASEWLDTFAVAGLRPAITGEWGPVGDATHLALAAQPAVTLDVPVVVSVGEARSTRWVRLVDGRGEAHLPAGVRVEVDPTGDLPFRSVSVARRGSQAP